MHDTNILSYNVQTDKYLLIQSIYDDTINGVNYGSLAFSEISDVPFHLACSNGLNDTNIIKNIFCRIKNYSISNISNSGIWVKFYEYADNNGNPNTFGSCPIIWSIFVPANETKENTCNIRFKTGISFATVTGFSDNNTTGINSNSLQINVTYKGN